MRYLKVVIYILFLATLGPIYFEWNMKDDMRIFSEAIYECDYDFSEVISSKELLATYVIGSYWKKLGSSINESDDLHSMVEMLFTLQSTSYSKCDQSVISQLNNIKSLGYEFSTHRDENDNSLVLVAIVLQNVVFLDWMLKNNYYTDMKLNDTASEYDGMDLPELAESFNSKISDTKSAYISKVIHDAHAEKYEKI